MANRFLFFLRCRKERIVHRKQRKEKKKVRLNELYERVMERRDFQRKLMINSRNEKTEIQKRERKTKNKGIDQKM